jgi:hypothetical protein
MRPPKFVDGKPTVEWRADSGKMRVWYCEAFPLERLRYKDLWELDELGRKWREALRDDIKNRGMKTPLVVWNHYLGTMDQAYLSKKPYMLRVGRNRMWALVDLEWTHAPVIGTGDCEYEHEELCSAQDILKYWKDGSMIVQNWGLDVTGKVDATEYKYPK